MVSSRPWGRDMDFLKLIASAFGLAEFFAKKAQQSKDEENGAAKQQAADKGKALETLADVSRPVARSESDRLWEQNKGKFGPDPGPWEG